MATAKTVVFGSLFALNHVGVDQLVERIRSNYPDEPTVAPFVAYDYDKNVLSSSIDRSDIGTSQFLLAQLKLFIDHEHKNPQVIEPAIRPLEGALVRTEIDYANTKHEAAGLLDVTVNGYNSNDPLKALEHVTTYWAPRDGEIKILTTAVAEEIAKLTGCSIYPESLEGRVRLVGGDFSTALKKLQNLEPLLALQYQQRLFSTVKSNTNVLLRTTDEPSPIMAFERVNNPDHAAYHRVIVEQGPQVLQGKLLCESRIPGAATEESIPENLMLLDVSETNTIGRCRVWDNFTYDTLGDGNNKHPRNAPAAEEKKATGSPQSKLGTNDYIDPGKAARVAVWSGQVDENVDPNSVAPEVPDEPSKRRRRVAADSDDEDDEQEDPADPPTPRAVAPEPQAPNASPPHNPSIASSVVVSDLLKLEGTECDVSMVPAVPTQPVASPPSPAPEAVAISWTRIIRAASDSESSKTEQDEQVEEHATGEVCAGSQESLADAAVDDVASEVPQVPVELPSDVVAKFGEQGDRATNVENNTAQDPLAASQQTAQSSGNLDEASSHLASTLEVRPITSSSGSSPDGLATTMLWPPKGFHPNAYGAFTRGSQAPRAATSGPGSKPDNQCTSSSSSNSNPLAPYQGGRGDGKRGPRKCGTRHRGRDGSKKAKESANNQSTDLIGVIDDDSSNRNPSPPPSFDIRMPMGPVREEPPVQPPNILDQPMEESRLASRATKSDLISFSSGSRRPPASHAGSEDSASYVNTVAYRGPNIQAIKNTSLAKLRAKQAEQEERRRQAARQANGNGENGRLHSTMTQQAGNPGKKGQQKQESKTEKKKRTEQALREAYGDPATAKPQKSSKDLSEMSKKKRQMLNSNYNMAVANPEALQAESRRQATEGLVSGLGPIFEASRAFSGEVRFEFQLGQILISSDSSIREKTVNLRKWDKLFGQAAKSPVPTSFTPALTTNGADIDRALEVRSFRGGKLWDASSPGPQAVFYEFECQSKHGKNFLLVLDQSGNFELRSSSDPTIGMVGLHCPAQVWDACAVVYGVENWTAPCEMETSIAAFVGSIHVLPDRHQLVIVFRQPDDNVITIKNVRMRRVSRHHCLIMDYQGHQLQVTEVKSLYTKVHPEDKKLWQAYEKSHADMIQDGFVHYEISIIDKGVNDVLGRNKNLELGELASPSAGKELLRGERIKQMVNLTAHLVSKIDWMGSRNNGTLARATAARELQRIRQQQSLPPMARSKINPLVSATRIDPSRFAGTGVAVSATGSEVLSGRRQLPGTRFGTLAEIYEDEHGRFAKGYGGARVPLGDHSVLGTISEAPIEPDDSASQIGRVQNMAVSSTGRARDAPMHAHRGPGFW